MTKKTTLGQAYLKTATDTPVVAPVVEVAQERLKDYLDNVIRAIQHAQKKWQCWDIPCPEGCTEHIQPVAACYSAVCADYCKQREAYLGDLFVEVHEIPNKLMPGVIKHQFQWKTTCPRPNYDQTVFRYVYKTEELIHLWTIPSKDVCLMYLENARNVVPEEQELLSNICRFADGTLYKIMKTYNGEEMNSPLLVER